MLIFSSWLLTPPVSCFFSLEHVFLPVSWYFLCDLVDLVNVSYNAMALVLRHCGAT